MMNSYFTGLKENLKNYIFKPTYGICYSGKLQDTILVLIIHDNCPKLHIFGRNEWTEIEVSNIDKIMPSMIIIMQCSYMIAKYIYIYIYIYIYLYIYVCMYVCMYLHSDIPSYEKSFVNLFPTFQIAHCPM